MNGEFVKRHAKFGKSRPKRNDAYPDVQWYGSRKSDKLIRCYRKEGISAYRVELELHSSWLRKHDVQGIEDLAKLPGLLFPSHIRFVGINWAALARYLRRRNLRAGDILRTARELQSDLQELLFYLRHEVGVKNVHRFLVPMSVNKTVQNALNEWGKKWSRRK